MIKRKQGIAPRFDFFFFFPRAALNFAIGSSVLRFDSWRGLQPTESTLVSTLVSGESQKTRVHMSAGASTRDSAGISARATSFCTLNLH